MRNALVLLSGGLDSVAALHHSKEHHEHVRTVCFDYGQPHRDAELVAAQRIAARRGISIERERIFVRGAGRLGSAPGAVRGVSRSSVAARNMVLLTHAAALAVEFWPGEGSALILGCNQDDSATFPDCRPAFLSAAEAALQAAIAGLGWVTVRAPWIYHRKAQIVEWCRTRFGALEDIRESVSCYRGTGCGSCDACALRAKAFEEAGVEDGLPAPVVLHGGDPDRARRTA